MLKSVVRFPFCMFGKTQYYSRIEIFIMIFDIGIGVMQYIVLYLPVKYVTSQNVDAAAHQFIDPRVFGKGTVVSIVHYIHAHSCHANTNERGQQKLKPIVDV